LSAVRDLYISQVMKCVRAFELECVCQGRPVALWPHHTTLQDLNYWNQARKRYQYLCLV